MRRTSTLWLGPILLLSAWVLAACSQEAEATPTSSPAPAETVQVDILPRRGLQATDPTSVELAAGEPTLVEFFAYW